VLTFLASIYLLINFDYSEPNFQFVFNSGEFINHADAYINLSFGVDGISILFVLLTTFLMPLCLVVSVGAITSNVKTYAICFLMMESFLLLTFTSLHIICFYIFFEAVLIPMFILVSAYGSRERRVRAAYLLFMYTLIGSILMLFGILYIVYTVGSSDIVVLRNIVPFIFSESTQKLL
jgi:NADH:ubiquinone oxidoreductase subunit 4 (subunit M)